jgi:predicted MPP superfamily phosphohydrolase
VNGCADLTRRQLFYLSTASLVTVVLGLGYTETRKIEVKHLNVNLGKRVAFLADFHINALGGLENDIVRLVNGEHPDIIMLGGDTVDEYTQDMETASRCLSELDAKQKFAVMGNHEHWSSRVEGLTKILDGLGFDVLFNSEASSLAGKVYGLDWRDDRKYPQIDAEGIVLVHDPNAAESISGRTIILSGHTHGGVEIAGIGFSNSIYTRGLFKLNEKTTLYVSRGVGQIFPWRPTSPLEIVLVE